MGQAGYEYKLFGGRISSQAEVEETEVELSRAAREGWRVVAVPEPARAGGDFVLLLEREAPLSSGAQAPIDQLQRESAEIELEAAKIDLEAAKARLAAAEEAQRRQSIAAELQRFLYQQTWPREKFAPSFGPGQHMDGNWFAAQEKETAHE